MARCEKSSWVLVLVSFSGLTSDVSFLSAGSTGHVHIVTKIQGCHRGLLVALPVLHTLILRITGYFSFSQGENLG